MVRLTRLWEVWRKWKVRQKFNLDLKCNSIYTATWMHTSLCCVVLNTSAFFRSIVNARISILERQKPTKNTISFFLPSWARETPCLFVIEIGKKRNPSPTSPTVQIWAFICREWWPTIAEIWDGRENRNAPDSPDLTPSIPDDRGYLRFLVFISRQNLGQSGNSKIYDSLEFSRHLKTSERSKRRSSALNKVDESFLWLKNYWAYSLGRGFLLTLSLFCFYITASDILLQINNSIKMR